jgi:hypothetical protein
MVLKTLIPIVITTLLLGCSQPHTEFSSYQNSLESDPMFKDCIAKKVSNSYNSIVVIRCPVSTTTTYYKVGKNPSQTSVVIDGITYEAKN